MHAGFFPFFISEIRTNMMKKLFYVPPFYVSILFRVSFTFLVLLLGVGVPENQTSNAQDGDLASKRDTKK